MSLRFASCLAVLLLAPPFAARAAGQTSGSGEAPRCAFQRKGHPDYILWVCNPDGTAHSRDSVILWTRRTQSGARVMTEVWNGPTKDLLKQAETVIAHHERSHAHCDRYFHLARTQDRGMDWNVGSAGVRTWLASGPPAPLARLCYSTHPAAADFVIVWGDAGARMPNAFTVDVPTTTDGFEEGDGRPREADAGRAAAGTPLSVSVYRVQPGLDGTIVRLGTAVFTSAEVDAGDGPRGPDALLGALRFLATMPPEG
jgi:hypothetical protein